MGSGNPPCPKCEGATRKAGNKLLAGGRRAQQYQCKNCGHTFRER